MTAVLRTRRHRRRNGAGRFRIIGAGEDLLEQGLVAVLGISENIRPVAGLSAKLRSAPGIGVDEVILVERRDRVQRDERTPLDQIAPGLGDVVAGPGIAVDVEPSQAGNSFPPLRVHDLGVCGGVFLDDRELDLGPDTDFVVLNPHNKTVSRMFELNLTQLVYADASRLLLNLLAELL